MQIEVICKICNNKSDNIFSAVLLQKHNVKYYHCSNCGFLQTEEPYWLGKAYKKPINIEDTGLLERNILLSKRTSLILFFLFNRKGRFLDYAGGYGVFVRLMRDLGFNFLWNDLYAENLFARGFEFKQSDHKNNFELVTVFECFEHFVDPIREIEGLLKLSKNILFSTEVFKGSPPVKDEWDYYGFSHGQHIAFYSINTLKTIAKKYNLYFYSNNKSFHLFSEKKISNLVFNILLKLSLLGIPSIIKNILGSKTLPDFHKMKLKR